MENPATWGRAELVVRATEDSWWKSRDEGIVGLSLARMITDALRDAGLLVEGA